jgi:hypothetical protein
MFIQMTPMCFIEFLFVCLESRHRFFVPNRDTRAVVLHGLQSPYVIQRLRFSSADARFSESTVGLVKTFPAAGNIVKKSLSLYNLISAEYLHIHLCAIKPAN